MLLKVNLIKIECLTYDLQKVSLLPRIPTHIVYYKRQLSMFNMGIHCGSKNKGYFYTWVETAVGRGSQDIGSVVKKHIDECIPNEVETLILWSNSCGGQNCNIKICLLMQYVLYTRPSLKSTSFNIEWADTVSCPMMENLVMSSVDFATNNDCMFQRTLLK